MNKIFEVALIIIICALLYLFFYYVYKRIYAMKKLSSLKESSGAKITRCRCLFASYFKLSEKPDVIVEIGNCVYFVRLLNGRGGRRFMHFASREYFVTYSKMRLSIGNLTYFRGRRGMSGAPGFITTGAHSVKILPKLDIPDEYIAQREIYGKILIPVLILNPAPNEVSYVTENKTSIKVAFTGDEIYGQKIFTVTSFSSYAERVKRAESIYTN